MIISEPDITVLKEYHERMEDGPLISFETWIVQTSIKFHPNLKKQFNQSSSLGVKTN